MNIVAWIKNLLPKSQPKVKAPVIPDHCALGYGLRPQVGYSDGTVIYSKAAALIVNREFSPHDPDNLDAWPRDPKTGIDLPIKP